MSLTASEVNPDAIAFVDAHMHLWNLSGSVRYPWLVPPFSDGGPNGSVEPIAHDYLPGAYCADVAGWDLKGAVHVDAGADPLDALDETRWLTGISAASGLPNAIVAYAPLHDPKVQSLLEAQAAHPLVRGIRQIVSWHPDSQRSYMPHDLTQDDQWWAGYGLLAQLGLSFDLQCYAGQMPSLVPLIARHPDVTVIINHCGMPVARDREGFTRWRHGMQLLAQLPHVCVKLSGVGFIRRSWSTEAIRPVLLELVEMFGSARCLVASNAPTDKLFAPIAQHLQAYRDVLGEFSGDEQRAMFGRTANRVYRLGLNI